MADIGRNLKKKGVIIAVLSLVLMNIGCEDKIDNPPVNPSEGKTVEVSLNIGFADEADDYTLATKSGASSDKGAFSCELQPAAITKGNASVKPDKLYRLEIVQYDNNGKYQKRLYVNNDNGTTIGSKITLELTKLEDCQLVIVAWGKENTTVLGAKVDLDKAQKVSIPAGTIQTIDPNKQDDMNKMPYILHLKHIKVESNTIKSIDGNDARLLLKRLATRLNICLLYTSPSPRD